MAKLFNRARMTTATVGTGTIALGAAVSNAFLTFAESGVANGDVVAYVIEDGADFESGIGTYTTAGTTLSRTTVRVSKIAGAAGTAKINLSGTATVFLSPAKEDLLSISENAATNQVFAGPASGGAAPPAFRALVNADTPNMVPTRQYLLSGTGATYTTPAGCRKIVVREVGGGGGGGGATANNGTVGNPTTFNSITAAGGSLGPGNNSGGSTGGTGGAGTASLRLQGGDGQGGSGGNGACAGGNSVFGGAGKGQNGGAGSPGKANTGGGGGGGSSGASGGSGGAAGEYAEFSIPSPAASYTFTVGASAAGGAAGGQAGGAGGSGLIIVEEYY